MADALNGMLPHPWTGQDAGYEVAVAGGVAAWRAENAGGSRDWVKGFAPPGSAEALACARAADALVLGIAGHEAEVRRLVRGLAKAEATTTAAARKGPKVVVGVGSVLSWALTPPLGQGPGGPGGDAAAAALTARHAPDRQAAPADQLALEAERLVERCGRAGGAKSPGAAAAAAGTKAYVVHAGVPYGLGEMDGGRGFHGLFKEAWETRRVPRYGPGANRVPTVHVADLARYIGTLIAATPPGGAYIAVDEGQVTQAEIAAAVAETVGVGGEVYEVPGEALLLEDVPRQLLLDLDLRRTDPTGRPAAAAEPATAGPAADPATADPAVEPEPLPTMASRLAAPGGGRDEYLAGRGLRPLKLLVVGPPLSARDALARALAEQYAVPVLTQREALARRGDLSAEDQAAVAEELGEDGAGEVSAALLAKLWRHALRFYAERSHGFVLCPYPYSLEAAEALFRRQEVKEEEPPKSEGEGEAEEAEDPPPAAEEEEPAPTFEIDPAVLPEFVVSVACAEELLRARAEAMEGLDVAAFDAELAAFAAARQFDEEQAAAAAPEGGEAPEGEEAALGGAGAAEPPAYGGFLKFLADAGATVLEYADAKTPEAPEEHEEHEEEIDEEGPEEEVAEDERDPEEAFLAGLLATIGKPRNYLGFPEKEAAAATEAAQAAAAPAEPDAEQQRQEAYVREQRAAEQEAAREVNQRAAYEERELGNPLRRVLMKDIMPAVTKALIKLCAERPEEPIVFLGEFLKKEQPATEA